MSKKKTKIFAYDLETKSLGGEIIIQCIASSPSEFFFFKDFSKLFDFIKQHGFQYDENKKTNQVFAHYGGKYDYLYLMQYLKENTNRFYVHDILIINSHVLFKVYDRKNNVLCDFRDSFLLIPFSLDKATKIFNKKYFKLEYDDYEEHKDENKLKKYLLHDVLSLLELLNNYKKYLKIRKFKYTLPAHAFEKLKNTKCKDKKISELIKLNRRSDDFYDYFRKFYHGARVEVFKRYSDKEINCYDVNSLYPFVMHNYQFPFSQRFYYSKDENEIKQALKSNKICLLDVYVKSKEDYYIPPLCLRSEIQKQKLLVFPNLKNFNHLYITHADYDLIKNDHVIYFISAIIFEEKDYLFREFIEKYYDMKSNSKNSIEREIAKLILNSSYGKFSQRRTFRKILTLEEFLAKEFDINLNENEYEEVDDNFYVVNEKQKLSKTNCYYNPIYAILITSYARNYMFKFLNKFQKDVLYTDTDCLYLTTKMNKNEIDDKQLGKFKHEASYDEAYLINPKSYLLIKNNDYKVRFKSIPRCVFENKEIDKLKTIFEKLLNSTNKQEFEFNSFLTFKESLRRHEEFAKTINNKKIIQPKFLKRRLKENNIDTEAHEF